MNTTKKTIRSNKNLLFLLMLVIISFTFSCSSDDDALGTINETFIIVEWRLSNITENGMDISLNDCQLLKTLEFNISDEVIITTYIVNADDVCEMDSNITKDYSISNSTITIESLGDSQVSTPRNETLILNSTEASNVIIKTYTRQ